MSIRAALRAVFSRPVAWLQGAIASGAVAAVYIHGGGLVSHFPEGVYVDIDVPRIAALAVLALLAGIAVPLNLAAARKRHLAAGGTGALGLFGGLAAMSCCAPLLLPALLSFAGFSGTFLLSLSAAAKRYFLPLSLVSVTLVALSAYAAARSVAATCALRHR